MLQVNKDLIEQLLYEGESDELDFKSEQYLFEKADIRKKSEVLKDLLAFANSWRRADAYILIGVQDGKGERAKVVGVSNQIDDAALQQFVNGKTQKHITFSYIPFKFEDKDIAIIHIPLQERPFYLQKQCGPLKARTVYVRRGSATEEASPEEIAKMGRTYERELPDFDLQFCSEGRDMLGSDLAIRTTDIAFPEEIPDYSSGIMGTNRNYYRKKAEFLHKLAATREVGFTLYNSGNANANNADVEIIINDPAHELYVLDEHDFPRRPRAHYIAGLNANLSATIIRDITVKKITHGWEVHINLGTIQPKQRLYSRSKLYVGSRSNREINLEARIFADDLAEPAIVNLLIKAEVEHVKSNMEDLEKFPLE